MAGQLAEIGVILLMFGVGLHFSLADLLAVRRRHPGRLQQIAVATAARHGAGAAWGWSAGAGLVFGLALSVASTVVLLQALEERNGLIDTSGPHRRRLADRRGHGDGACAGAAAGASPSARRARARPWPGASTGGIVLSIAITLRQGGGLRRRWPCVLGPRWCHGC